MKRVALLLVALALVLPAAAWAQGKTNFSGTWKFEREDVPPGGAALATDVLEGREGRPGSGFGVVAATLVVKQTPTELTIVSTTQKGSSTTTAVFRLDGSEHVTEAQGGHDRSMTKVRWDRANLVLHMYQSMQQMRDIWSVGGNELIIARVLGMAGSGGGAHKLIYRKAS